MCTDPRNYGYEALLHRIIDRKIGHETALRKVGIAYRSEASGSKTGGTRPDYHVTEEQVREFARLRNEEGWTFRDLSQEFGVSDTFIIAKLKKYGLMQLGVKATGRKREG